ncbi:MAG: hypothetical protein H7301_10185 [Cryobacterium sp.]|nr:hypothetical protein [Oligoflexia bacterium]
MSIAISQLIRLILSVLICSLVTPSVFARPLDGVVTYAQFETLLKLKSGDIPDLAPLRTAGVWDPKWKDVYVSGGCLRGLSHWIYDRLQTQSYSEVALLPVPEISQLLRISWSDRDLVAPDALVEKLKTQMTSGWDVLSESFQNESTVAGGPGLDKSRVNPFRVVDPLNGLKDYYHGRIVFHEASGSINGEQLKENSVTAMALRYLREAVDLPELHTTTESLARVAKAGESERLSPNNYWVNKALHKLYLATHEDAAKTLIILRDSKLLHRLADDHFKIGEVQRHVLSTERELKSGEIALSLVHAGFNFQDLIASSSVAGFLSTQARAQFLDVVFEHHEKEALDHVSEFMKTHPPSGASYGTIEDWIGSRISMNYSEVLRGCSDYYPGSAILSQGAFGNLPRFQAEVEAALSDGDVSELVKKTLSQTSFLASIPAFARWVDVAFDEVEPQLIADQILVHSQELSHHPKYAEWIARVRSAGCANLLTAP